MFRVIITGKVSSEVQVSLFPTPYDITINISEAWKYCRQHSPQDGQSNILTWSKASKYSTDFTQTWIFSKKCSKRPHISNLMKISLVGANMFHADRQIWRSKWSFLSTFRTRLKNCQVLWRINFMNKDILISAFLIRPALNMSHVISCPLFTFSTLVFYHFN